MSKTQLATQLLKIADAAVQVKARVVRRQINRTVGRTNHKLMMADVERDLQKVLTPLIKKQVDSIVSRLRRQQGKLIESLESK